MTNGHDLTRLQELLRASKELSARGEALVSDSDGAALIRNYEDLLERALNAGNAEVAAKAADTLADLQEKEAHLRQMNERLDERSQEALALIIRLRDAE